MTGVIVVSHGGAGPAMVEAVERLTGRLDVHVVEVGFGEPRGEVQGRLEQAVATVGAAEVLFLVDLEGSTPFNLCCKHCEGGGVVLGGVNLPMLCKLATADRSHSARALAEELQATGVKSIHIRGGECK